MKIAIGADHAGYDLKQELIQYLTSKVFEVEDFGCHSADSVDYADFAHPVAEVVESQSVDFGILICGSGNGISMTANKHQGIRCALSWNSEIAKLAREHNDANILSLPARFISSVEAREIVDIFLATPFEGGRHQRRIEKMRC